MLQPENELQTYKRSLVRADDVTKSGKFSGATPLRRDPSPGLNGAFSKKVPLLSTGANLKSSKSIFLSQEHLIISFSFILATLTNFSGGKHVCDISLFG